jgi:phage terminase large subunit GpA-like protein
MAGRPIAERPTLTTAHTKKRGGRVKVHLVQVGTDTAKNTLFHRLQVAEPGPGYIHFSIKHRAEFFDQLTSEERHIRHKMGVPYHVWILPSGKRNEALDCAVYALAAFRLLGPLDMERRVARVQAGGSGSTAIGGTKKRGRRVRSRGVK